MAELDVRADTGWRIAQAADRDELAPLLVELEEQAVLEAEPGSDAAERRIDDAGGIAFSGDHFDDAGRRHQAIARGRGVPFGLNRRSDAFNPEHSEDIEAAQPHDARHADLGTRGVEMPRQLLKERPVVERIGKGEVQAELGSVSRIHGNQRRLRVEPDVCRCLGEELVRERDMIAVHHGDMRKIGDIRNAIAVGGSNDRRHDPFEASLEIEKTERHVAALQSLVPARAPGVCRKISATAMLTRSGSRLDSHGAMISAATPSRISVDTISTR
ncbi:hypothetical protein FQZ97_723140 [compost metagenome]